MKRTRFFILAVALAACQNTADPQVVALVGTERINREVTLTHIVPQPVSPALEGSYEILVTNRSPRQYVFTADFGVRLLIYSEKAGVWREVENLTTYLPPDTSIVLQPRGNWPEDEVPISVWPVFQKSSDDTALRVIVVGHDEDGEAVAAFVDIPLNE
jgi:hypothetical protein